MMRDTDGHFMEQALALARRGLYTSSPNPRVGCVIVADDGSVLGQGYHQRTGLAHAETQALAAAGAQSAGATMYVTLEPCAHQGHTPPCTDAIVAAGMRRVVSAIEDPDPRVCGAGHDALRRAGIECATGIEEDAARELNRGFFRRVVAGRPWVCIKQAGSLDGRSALADGRSQWITSQAARNDVQHLRARSCAVLSTARTVARDNARLNVRLDAADLDIDAVRQPLRVVLDRAGECTAALPVWAQAGDCVVYTTSEHAARLGAELPDNVQVRSVDAHASGLDLPGVLASLAADHAVNELLVEAGAKLGGALLEADLVDELIVYCAPRLLGSDAQSLFDLAAATELPAETDWEITDAQTIGGDVRITCRRRGA